MAKPTPSPSQTEAINKEVAGNNAQTAALVDSAALQGPIIAQKQEVDDAFKNLFDWYNDSIIGKYDIERKSITGFYIASPVVEADIIGVGANPPSGRLVPAAGLVDIVRIPEFDGTAYTTQSPDYEQIHIPDQAYYENLLVNGYTASTYSATLKTFSALTPTSTTLDIQDTAVPITGFVVGTIFIVHDVGMTDVAFIKVTNVTSLPGGPPYNMTLDIELLVPPVGTLAVASLVKAFNGFTNAERTTKTTTIALYQGIMNYLIARLQDKINDRISRLNEQLAALAANEDPDAVAAIGTATTNATTSKNFLTNYLITTDISNTGIASLSTERSVRSGQLTARMAQILAAYTGQTEDYYEQRYQTANNRGNLQRGTLRAKSNAENVVTVLNNLAAGLAGANNALNGILP